MQTRVTISEAAEFLNISVDTIRRWEKKGLVKSARDTHNYRVFSVDELKRLQSKLNSSESHSKYQVIQTSRMSPFTSVELFAGAGGLSLGFENAGIHGQMFVEYDKNPVATLRKNRPDWNVVHDDVSKVDFSSMKVDILAGGFPCQAFSYAGHRLGFDDIRGTLFFEFARAIREIKPKIVVGENVRGLLNHDDGRTFQTMLGVFDELGYRVEYKILRGQYLDVPQKRERLVMIGVPKNSSLKIFFPKEQDYTISMREALNDVPVSEGQSYPAKKQKIMELIPEGGYWRDLPKELQKEYMGASYFLGGGKTGMARRLAWNEPSLTLTCSPGQKQTERCHPSETRPLTVREYARIQSFPDDWEFEGSVAAQYRQIGNAVPVNLGYHIGRCVVAMLEKRFDKTSMEMSIAPKSIIQDQISLF